MAWTSPRRTYLRLKLGLGLCLSLGLLSGAPSQALGVELCMQGDSRVFAQYMSMRNYTGWDQTGQSKENKFALWQRSRWQSDFSVSEALKFRFSIKLENNAWGGPNAMMLDNPQPLYLVYEAYLFFKWPESESAFTLGYQPVSFPQSAFMGGSVVLGSDSGAAFTSDIPLSGDTLHAQLGYISFLNLWPRYADSASQPGINPGMRGMAGSFDNFVLALPLCFSGLKLTPWAALSLIGRDSALAGGSPGNFGFGPQTRINEDIISVGTLMRPQAGRLAAYAPASMAAWYSAALGTYAFAGLALEWPGLGNFNLSGDFIAATGGFKRRADSRCGWFADLGLEYSGLDNLTPQVSGWWSSGEDASFSNGSQRLPTYVQNWGPSNSFLFDSMQDFTPFGPMYVNPVGSRGLNLSLNNVTFLEGLSHRLTFSLANGSNSPTAVRRTVESYGSGMFFQMGRDLTSKEWLYAVAFDHKYAIYENLALILETGWSHGNFQKNVWGWDYPAGRGFASRARDSDAYKLSLGFLFKF